MPQSFRILDRRTSFQDEFRKVLERYQIPYDERYVWE